MRTDLNSGGFTLYEILISIKIVGIMTDLHYCFLFPLLDRSELVNTVNQFKYTLQESTLVGTK